MKETKIQRTYEWLQSEIEKDNKDIELQKQKTINEIRSLDRSKMFPPKEKISTLKKIMIALGYVKREKR